MPTLFNILLLVLMFVPPGVPAARRALKAEPAPTPRNLAILLFEGVQIVDYTGPYETFGHAWDNGPMFNIYTVAAKPGPITTAMGMVVTPTYTFANCPKPNVLVLPGGNVDPNASNPEVIKWVQTTSRDAEFVMSVCNGAFFLAKAGMLDGLTATTYHSMIDDLQKAAPTCKAVYDERFVDNGKIITTAGISSGIDGSLHLIERLAGKGVAQNAALGMEYNWQPEAHYARANLADRYLRKMLGHDGFPLPDTIYWHCVSNTGDTESWTKSWATRPEISAEALMKIVDTKIAESWKRTSPSGGLESQWEFKDDQGGRWTATAKVTMLESGTGTYGLSVSLERAR
ncbi:MAG TPA: DJ-1/PfpI family protein [Blastocatellia bacterium]|nr:DJ-1/PfpI family protein [Blastocatellia bacterium]